MCWRQQFLEFVDNREWWLGGMDVLAHVLASSPR